MTAKVEVRGTTANQLTFLTTMKYRYLPVDFQPGKSAFCHHVMTVRTVHRPVSNPLTVFVRTGEFDVICGRGRKCYAHVGNDHFRELCAKHRETYTNCTVRTRNYRLRMANSHGCLGPNYHCYFITTDKGSEE